MVRLETGPGRPGLVSLRRGTDRDRASRGKSRKAEGDEPGADGETGLALELIDGGAELTGAATGAAVGLIGGPGGAVGGAVIGVVATRAIRRVLAEMRQRLGGPRQRMRAGAAYLAAAEVIDQRLAGGDALRADGFFEADAHDAAPAEELLEGVLQVAADANEERKIPFLGQLYASIAFDAGVSRAHANYLIALARRLTFRQLALIAVIWEADAAPMIEEAGDRDPPQVVRFNEELGVEVDELERFGLVGRGEPGGTFKLGGATFTNASGMDIGGLTLPGLGKRMYELMGLVEISEGARSEVLADLVVGARG